MILYLDFCFAFALKGVPGNPGVAGLKGDKVICKRISHIIIYVYTGIFVELIYKYNFLDSDQNEFTSCIADH